MSIEPRRFGDYHVIRRLGVGGMAEVYVAERRGPAGFRREVALKILRPHLRDTRGVAERFTREARLAAGLRHPNLVPVIDFGLEHGVAYLAMELVDGPDLRRATLAGVRAGRPLPPGLAVHVAIQVARGLAYAHRRADAAGRPLGLVHRDVSPQNVLLSRSGEVRLSDFGVATAAWAAEESGSGTLRGKLAYLAPEQLDRGAPDARADVFALGIVLWELLAGRRLFLAPTEAETLARVRRCEVPLPPEPGPPGVPGAVWAALRRALAREPEARETTAAGLASALAAAWPESDRGDAAAGLAAWLAEVGALDPGPGGAARDAGAAAPVDDRLLPLAPPPSELTPTLVTVDRGAAPGPATGAGRRRHGRRAALAAGLLVLVAVATSLTMPRLAPPGGQDDRGAAATAQVAAMRLRPASGPPDGATVAASPAPASGTGPIRSDARPARAPQGLQGPRISASVIVTSHPAGAAIEIDRRPAGRTPRRLDGLEPGRPIVVVLRLDGHRAAERTVTPNADGTSTVDVALEPAFGLLSIDADPWAEVAIDGVPVGATPLLQRRVPAGRRHVRLVHPPSGRIEEIVLQVDPDGDVRRRVSVALPPGAGDSRQAAPDVRPDR